MNATLHAVAMALATASPHAQTGPWPHGDPNAVAKSILAQPTFAHAGTSSDAKPTPSLWDIIWNWLRDTLGPIIGPIFKRLFGGVFGALSKTGTGSVLGIALIVVSVLGIVYAIVRLAIAFVRPVATRARVFAGLSLGDRGTPAGWREVARDAAARGDFRLAIAALFAAAIAALDDRAIVRFDPARTPGEYRRVVRRAAAAAAPPFDELSERFVRASFAEIAASDADFGAALGALDRFEPALAPAAETRA